ncbi:TPA: hypothetical protein ACXN37_000189 [Stenotrophomonas maltophilia]|uniref:hypothetical protein n=1 Tax=Stenotrophomonas maltophilia TaxID=40324 RepID=UPI0013DC7688|nr:hypothetical protein [Stenotrophomonas maltophilia]
MTTDNKALAVDVLAVLRSQLSWIGPCRPDGDEIDCERWDRIELAISAVAELIEEAEKIEAFIYGVGMQCKPFSYALARVKGESA